MIRNFETYYVGNAPSYLKQKSKSERAQLFSESKTDKLALLANHSFRYYCSACLIIRDENEYLEEWLKWHIGQGVEHFYIYDHGSEHSVREFLRTIDSSISDVITLTEWTGSHQDAQPDAYNDCLRRFRWESRWIAFIDTDEQIRVKSGQSLPAFLKNYEQFAGLMAVWVTYDANGMKNKTPGTLRQRFSRVTRASEFGNSAGKSIVQAMLMDSMYIHNGKATRGFFVVNEHCEPIPDYALIPPNPSTDLISVDHFYTKSYEEWLNKIKRGSGHARFSRKYDDFFIFNPDMEKYRENIMIHQKYENGGKAEAHKRAVFSSRKADGSQAVYRAKRPIRHLICTETDKDYNFNIGKYTFTVHKIPADNKILDVNIGEYSLSTYLNNMSPNSSFSLSGTSTEGKMSVSAHNVLHNVNLSYDITNGMISEKIMIDDRSPDYEYCFSFLLNGMYANVSTDEKAVNFSMNGEPYPQITLTVPSMRDSQGAQSDSLYYKVTFLTNEMISVNLCADADWLNAPERVYPVVIS